MLIGALGERVGWWSSQLTGEIALRRLQIPFPRTYLRASLEGVTLVARRVHDGPLGPRHVHLFRLRGVQEDTVAHHLSRGVPLGPPPEAQDEILSALDAIGPPSGSNAPEGPCSLGRHTRLREHATIADLARVYAAAARARHAVIPYFDVEE